MSSRLFQIIENHKNLDELLSILKHYGVNAQYVAASVIEQFKNSPSDETDPNQETENDQGNKTELLEDLQQFYAKL